MVFSDIKAEKLSTGKNFSVFRGFPHNLYEVESVALTPLERELAGVLARTLSGKIGAMSLQHDLPQAPRKFIEDFNENIIKTAQLLDALEKIPSMIELEEIKNKLTLLLAGFFPQMPHPKNTASLAVDESIGFGAITPLIEESALEEIMVNGFGTPVFVVHRQFGMCKTNLSFQNSASLEGLVRRIAKSMDKPFSEEQPFLDARLSDGSRINATFPEIAANGITITVRKFSKVPMSIADLILMNTISSDAAAFLWLMVEGFGLEPMNIIVTGGTSSGKTTTLNALASFSRFSDRIVSIEDTLELDLGGRENWIRLESRIQGAQHANVSMDDLLRNALRMRPDRLVVGEVRGPEAQTLFVAMDTGHRGVLGTLHSNTAREMLLRLQQPPMNVAEVMLPLLNLIVVQVKLFLPGKGVVRRVSQIAELSSMNGKPLLANVFEWDRAVDKLKRTDTPSHVFELLSERTSLSKTDLKKELIVRQQILEWMGRQRILKLSDVLEMLQRYYYDPQAVIDLIHASVPAEAPSD